jgi:hypothetical protein
MSADQITAEGMPAVWEATMFVIFFAAMGLVDELHDTLKHVPIHAQNAPQWMSWLSYAALLIPIPILIYSHPSPFAHYAVTFAACQILGKKLDNLVFKATVIIGIPLVSAISFWLPESLSGTWPVLGMLTVIVCHMFYEIHDEVDFIVNLQSSGMLPTKLFTIIFPIHFCLVICVFAGLLPVNWLCCVSGGYPVAKAGFSSGALYAISRQSDAQTSVAQKSK